MGKDTGGVAKTIATTSSDPICGKISRVMDLYEPTDEPYTEPVTRKIALKLVTHGSVSVWWVDAIPYAKGLVLRRRSDIQT